MSSYEQNQHTWLKNKIAQADADDPILRDLKATMRETTEKVDACAPDDPKLIELLRDQTDAAEAMRQHIEAKKHR